MVSDCIYERRNILLDNVKKFESKLIFSSEKIKDFQPDERSKNFSGLISYLFYEYEYFDNAENYEELYDSVKKAFLYFQKAVNKE